MSIEDVFKDGELPEGWSLCAIGETCSFVTDGTHKTPTYAENGIRFLSTANLVPFKEGFDFTGYERFISKGDHEQLTKRCKPEYGDVLVSKCGTIGRTKEIDVDFPFSIFVGLALLKPLKGLFVPTFLEVFLNSPYMQAQLDSLSPGSTRRTLTIGGLKSAEFPLPPLSEQARIVDRVRELVATTTRVESRLSRIPQILKRFRQSVLAAACSGGLTEDWQKKHSGADTVERLVGAVLAERQAGWRRGQHRAPVEMEANELPEIPDHWQYVSLDTFVCDSFYGPRFGSDDYTTDGVPTIRTTDIGFDGSVDFHDPPRIRLNKTQLQDFGLEHEDLLVTRTGATIGKTALYDAGMGPAIPSAYLIRFRLTRNSLPAKYLLMFLMSPRGQQLLLGGSTAVAQPNVNAKNISRFPVPLPPKSEIEEIICRAEKLLAMSSAVEQKFRGASARVDKLTQSILDRAFRGELVPTEAELARREGRDYEPASVLLERIRAERESQAKSLPTSKRKLRKASAHV